MELGYYIYGDTRKIPGTFDEIIHSNNPVLIYTDKPENRFNKFDKKRKELGRSVREDIFYTMGNSGLTYTSGTIINNYSNGTHWEFDEKEGIFIQKNDIYETRHHDKMIGSADTFILTTGYETLIDQIIKEGYSFQN